MQTLRVKNSGIIRIENAKFSGYCVYINANIERDFQICISVPLKQPFSSCYALDFRKENISCNCGNSRCQDCNIIEKIHTLTSIVTSESFKVNHHLCCKDKWIIRKVCRNTRKEKQLIDLNYTGITIRKAIGNSEEVKNLCMNTLWKMVIMVLKKMY